MWSKCGAILLLVAWKSTFIHGYYGDKFFRKDYIYVDELNNFYKINMAQHTWAEAKINCALEGATLFYAEDEEEATDVIALWNVTQPKIEHIFIGVADWNVKNIFETVDGRQISDIYDNWAYNEPNNEGGNEGCVVMLRDGSLKTENCDHKYAYICKKPLATVQWNKLCNIPDMNYKYSPELDRCYKFHLTPMNWTEAYTICNAEQSYLAIVNSVLENQYLINITAEAPKDEVQGDYLRGAVHLGFHTKNGFWETIKGVLLHESGFAGWGYTQPDGGGNENCGSMFYTGQLNDIGCWQRMFFICEHEVDIRNEEFLYKIGSDSANVIPT